MGAAGRESGGVQSDCSSSSSLFYIHMEERGVLLNLWSSYCWCWWHARLFEGRPKSSTSILGQCRNCLALPAAPVSDAAVRAPWSGASDGKTKNCGEGREEHAGRRLEIIWVSSYIHHTCLLIAKKEQKFNTQATSFVLFFLSCKFRQFGTWLLGIFFNPRGECWFFHCYKWLRWARLWLSLVLLGSYSHLVSNNTCLWQINRLDWKFLC